MLVLGDSFGWGFGVEQDERFSEILERRHPDWEIINASVSGYGTDQQFLYLRERGLKLRPDVVLVLFSSNDFAENASVSRYWYNKPYFVPGDGLELRNVLVPPSTLKQRLDRVFFGRTYSLRRVYRIALRPLLAIVSGAPPDPESSRSPGHRRLVTSQLLAALHDLAGARGARLVLVSVPMGADPRAALAEIARDHGMPHLALDASFAAADEQPLTFPHDYH